MRISFSKYQGTGNDFVLVDDLKEELDFSAKDVARICDRHFGVGSDGLLLIRPSETGDFFMRFYNPDGSQAEMCGNGIRCFVKHLYDKKLISTQKVLVETLAGTKEVSLTLKDSVFQGAKVNMGEPVFAPGEVPVLLDQDEVVGRTIDVGKSKVRITCLSMGNPHTVIFVDNIDGAPVTSMGSTIEHLDLFPNRTNVEFAQVISGSEINLRVWERGAGETLACGTGACAALAAAFRSGLSDRKATIHLKGGDLEVDWLPQEGVYLTGPAEEVFEGEISI